MSKNNSKILFFCSTFLSTLMNPLFSLLFFLIGFSWNKMNAEQAVFNLLLMFFIVLLPITSWIFWNVKKGKYTNLDVSDRQDRNSLYFFNILALSLYLFSLNYTQQSEELLTIVIFVLLLLILMFISNLWIKSSIHTAFNFFMCTLLLDYFPSWAVVWFLLTLLLGISRIILKKHTPKEVTMGFLIAGIVSTLYLYTHQQF